jgi:hypothetical protein
MGFIMDFVSLATCRHQGDNEEFFTSYDEVFESFDDMGLQENLLRGIYAYGIQKVLSLFHCFNNTYFGDVTNPCTLMCRF